MTIAQNQYSSSRPDFYNGTLPPKRHHYNDTDYTIKTSVTIRVSPLDDYFVSWYILWGSFVAVSLVALWQVVREWKVLSQQSQAEDVEQTAGEVEAFSTADKTRCIFRRLILVALLSRVVFLPVQIWSNPLWWQFVSDSFPEMIFASAWSLLVTFFVQLVGIAMGLGSSTTPGVVIQATAYSVYILLIGLQLYNYVASVLLYALLCCIYAALLGVVIYFCPRLFSLLQPSMGRSSALSVRLFLCSFLCIFVFAAHTIGYGRRVVAPPRKVYWWWNYGALELLPSLVLLVMMHPRTSKPNRVDDDASNFRHHHNQPSQQQQQPQNNHHHHRIHSATVTGGVDDAVSASQSYPYRKPYMKRTDSSTRRLQGESTALLKGQIHNYGGTTSETPPPPSSS